MPQRLLGLSGPGLSRDGRSGVGAVVVFTSGIIDIPLPVCSDLVWDVVGRRLPAEGVPVSGRGGWGHTVGVLKNQAAFP